jgi:hypothetical protein
VASVGARQPGPRRGHVVGPLIVLGVGVLLLLNNLEMVPWSIWRDLWPYWPVLLVLLGLEALATGRVAWGTLVMLIILLPILGMIVGATSFSSHWSEATSAAPDRLTASLSQPLGEARAATVDVEYGAGALQVGPLPNDLAPATLADARAYGRGSVRFENASVPSPPTPPIPPTPPSPPNTPDQAARPVPPIPPVPPVPPVPSQPRLRILQRDDERGMDNGRFDLGRLDVRLTPAVPIDLRVASGVTDSTLNLEALRVPNLTVETGASQTKIVLPAHGETMARIQGGAAKLDLTVPPNVAARIILSDGPNAVSIDETRFPRQDREYRSAGFDTATDRVTLRIDVGASRLVVQ